MSCLMTFCLFALNIWVSVHYSLFTVFFLQIEDETQVSRATQAEQDHYEMHVRAANIVSISSAFQNKLRAQMF